MRESKKKKIRSINIIIDGKEMTAVYVKNLKNVIYKRRGNKFSFVSPCRHSIINSGTCLIADIKQCNTIFKFLKEWLISTKRNAFNNWYRFLNALHNRGKLAEMTLGSVKKGGHKHTKIYGELTFFDRILGNKFVSKLIYFLIKAPYLPFLIGKNEKINKSKTYG